MVSEGVISCVASGPGRLVRGGTAGGTVRRAMARRAVRLSARGSA